MKILCDGNNYSHPIHLLPGDTLNIEYTDHTGTRTVLSHQIEKKMSINYYAVAELEARELSQLGLKEGLAGIFGSK